MTSDETLELETPYGPARAHLHHPEGEPRGALMLGHGAGGSVTAPDLQAATQAAFALDVLVALVEQPYRVAGRRSPSPAHALDQAWLTVRDQLPLDGVPLVTGGRSSGARVACRTAAQTGSAGVLCLAFPLNAPNGKSRQDELDLVDVPVLVVQGQNDRFGIPAEAPGREVVVLGGDHGLKKDHDRLRAAVSDWLSARL